jgi:hypothetical protein
MWQTTIIVWPRKKEEKERSNNNRVITNENEKAYL